MSRANERDKPEEIDELKRGVSKAKDELAKGRMDAETEPEPTPKKKRKPRRVETK